MKKSLTIVLSVFLLLSVFASSLILADDVAFGTGNSAGVGNSPVNVGAAANAQGDGQQSGDQQNRPGVNPELSPQARNQIQIHTETEYEDNGRRVQVHQSVQNNNGSVIVNVQKTVTYANGTSYTYNISINNQNRTRQTTMEMEREGEHYNVSIQNGLNVSSRFFGNRSEIVANLSNGQQINVSVLPNQALDAVLARLRIMNQTVNRTKVLMQLKEAVHNHVPQVVYQVETNQNGRFLGIFKVAMKTNTEVNAENGSVVAVNRPWWAFLVSLGGAGNSGTTGNLTNGTSAPMIPVNSTNGTGSS